MSVRSNRACALRARSTCSEILRVIRPAGFACCSVMRVGGPGNSKANSRRAPGSPRDRAGDSHPDAGNPLGRILGARLPASELLDFSIDSPIYQKIRVLSEGRRVGWGAVVTTRTQRAAPACRCERHVGAG